MSEEAKRFSFAKAYPSDKLSEPDLLGDDWTVTITGWRYANKNDIGRDGKPMGPGTVLAFEETDKELKLPKLSHVLITRIHGPDPNKWVGKQVILFPTTCPCFGDPRTPCIRVRKIDPATGKPPDLF